MTITAKKLSRLFILRCVVATLALLCSVNISAADQQQQSQSKKVVALEQLIQAQSKSERCLFYAEQEDWVDSLRESTHGGLCHTAMWIDSLFGDEHQFNDSDFTAKLSVGFRQDEAEGFDPRVRVRINTRLPNVSRRFNAFVGRVDEEDYISNTEVDRDRVSAVGLRSTDADEAEWLIGIGYRDPKRRGNGFDYSIGAKLSHGFSPYARVTHRHLLTPGEQSYWRFTQTGFWRRQDGFGVSSSLDYTRLMGDRDIVEWDSSVKYTEDASQWEWITSSTWHHSFNRKRGISTRAYVRGEQDNLVSVPEYGATLTYVRPFLKPWLLLHTGVDWRFEKRTPGESYESIVRFGIKFEMLLGDYYGQEFGLKTPENLP